MDTFFNPAGIAVFGVSPSPHNVARTIFQNLIMNQYRGTIAGVGSKRAEWSGIHIYPSINEIPHPVDLAVLVTPARTIVSVLEECRRAGIERAVIMTAGFKEFKGNEDQLSADLVQAAHDLGIRFIGPNCQGVINTGVGLCLPFGLMPPDRLKHGRISVLSQSGTVAWMTSFHLSHEGIGVNKVVSMGNKMNVDEVDLVQYLLNDESTDSIILHLESTERGRELFELLGRSSKPVILYKTQISSQSHTVAYSHTAALADDDSVVAGAAWQNGVLRARTFRDMIEMAKALSLEPIKGNRLGMVAASGGVGIAGVDTCVRTGMELASLPQTCLDEIASFSKARVINLTNPVDTGTIYDSRINHKAMEMILALDNVDGGVLAQFPHRTGDYFEQIPDELVVQEAAELSRTVHKPIALHFQCDPLTRDTIKQKSRYPVFDTMEDAVNAMKFLWMFQQGRERARHGADHSEAESQTSFCFDPQIHPDLQGFKVVAAYGIPVEQPVAVRSEEEIVAGADDLGYPIALKALSPDFTHKLDAGAVILNLSNRKKLEAAVLQMRTSLKEKQARINTFLLQRMVSCGPELIFGGKRDPHYGPVVLLGKGGSDVEEKNRTLCCLAPVSPALAAEMYDAVTGGWGEMHSYREAVAEALSRFSRLLSDYSAIEEIDLNPVRLLPIPGMFTVLDVRVRLQ
ncbi:MAG TPA: acetate--CoA ligase family protein [Thermodesulfobacteriota bacterium]|nr:acetate--CoA ligase family protein [Deltaproteobacteria bacterium]HOC37982.1 acetate--CoA ligase family protein [Thermodesulfobacteriota bacterium]